MGLSNKRVFVSYVDDDEKTISGYFELIKEDINFIKIKSGSNIITVPYHKLKKMKESI